MTHKKKKQLGMPIGTASNRLVKSLLFEFAQKLSLTACYRCHQPIKGPDDMSIDHKVDWLDSNDPISLFFDTTNVALSHKICNSKARRVSRRIVDDRGYIRCFMCLEYLPSTYFYKNKNKPFGLSEQCKQCDNKRPRRGRRRPKS